MNLNQIIKRIDEYERMLDDIYYHGESFQGEQEWIEEELSNLNTYYHELNQELAFMEAYEGWKPF